MRARHIVEGEEEGYDPFVFKAPWKPNDLVSGMGERFCGRLLSKEDFIHRAGYDRYCEIWKSANIREEVGLLLMWVDLNPHGVSEVKYGYCYVDRIVPLDFGRLSGVQLPLVVKALAITKAQVAASAKRTLSEAVHAPWIDTATDGKWHEGDLVEATWGDGTGWIGRLITYQKLVDKAGLEEVNRWEKIALNEYPGAPIVPLCWHDEGRTTVDYGWTAARQIQRLDLSRNLRMTALERLGVTHADFVRSAGYQLKEKPPP